MNVEIGAEASLFPEKEYMYRRNSRCSAVPIQFDALKKNLNMLGRLLEPAADYNRCMVHFKYNKKSS